MTTAFHWFTISNPFSVFDGPLKSPVYLLKSGAILINLLMKGESTVFGVQDPIFWRALISGGL